MCAHMRVRVRVYIIKPNDLVAIMEEETCNISHSMGLRHYRCRSVLHRVAVLQCVVVRCSVLEAAKVISKCITCVPVCCSVLHARRSST